MGVGVGGMEGRGPVPLGGGGYVPGGGGMYCGATEKISSQCTKYDNAKHTWHLWHRRRSIHG